MVSARFKESLIRTVSSISTAKETKGDILP